MFIGDWRIQIWTPSSPIDKNLGLVDLREAVCLRHGGKFSFKSLTFGHYFV